MFQVRRAAVHNALTELFENKTPTLEEVLLCADFAVSVRNEVPQLMDFIHNPSNTANSKIPKLFDLALTPPPARDIAQLNCSRAAAAYLSAPNGRLHERYLSFKKAGHSIPYPYERITEFLRSRDANNLEIAGHFQRICTTLARWGSAGLFTHCPTLRTVILEKFEISAYAELFSAFLCEWPDAFCPVGETRRRYLEEFVKRAGASRPSDYSRVYNVFWALHAMRETSPTHFMLFREPSLFKELLAGATGIAQSIVKQSKPDALSLVIFSFRVLTNLMEVPEDNPDRDQQRRLEQFAAAIGGIDGKFIFAGLSSPVVFATFPVFYRAALIPTMNLFFDTASGQEQSTWFCSHYVRVLNLLEEKELCKLLDAGLVEGVLKALMVKDERGTKREFIWPRSVFIFRLAEKLCDASLLPFNLEKCGEPVKKIMRGDDWQEMARKVIQQRDFIADKIKRATDDDAGPFRWT
jgi:hypothetical protein